MIHFTEYANNWDTPEKIIRSEKYAKIIIQKLNKKSISNVLEIGCGTGLLGSHFLSDNTCLTGIDTSIGMLEIFNKKFKNNSNVQSINLNLEESNFIADKKFDLIISSMAFHHLKKPGEMILKLKKLLSANGLIAIIDLVTEPGNFHPNSKEMGFYHFGFSAHTVNKWGEVAGFENINVETIDLIKKDSHEFPIFLATYY